MGYAYAMKLQRRDVVTVVFLADGATEEGVYAESLNFAMLKQLPLLFVCENNGYAIHTHVSRRQFSTDLCARPRSFGIPAQRIEDGDVFSVERAANEIVRRLREGGGPAYLECLATAGSARRAGRRLAPGLPRVADAEAWNATTRCRAWPP